jgi:hypothetical protein
MLLLELWRLIMNRVALLAAVAMFCWFGAAFAQSNDAGNGSHTNSPAMRPELSLPGILDKPSDLPSDTTPNQQSSSSDRMNTPNTPMQNRGLPNGEGAPTGSITALYYRGFFGR